MSPISMLLIVLAIVATNAVRPPQGMEFIGVGLDALTGEIKLPVVGFTHNDGRTWVNPYTSEVHDVADQTVIYAEAEADMGVAVHWSLQDYATAVAQQAGVGEEFLGGAFAKSEVVLEAHAVFAGGENVLAVTTSSYALYAIAAAPSELLAVTPSFSKMLDLLPEEYDAVAYKKLVKNFGSHVVVQGVFGGSATLYTTVSTGFYAAVGVQAVGQVALAQFRNLTAVGAIAGAEASTAVAASEGIVTSYMNFQGGLWEEVDQYSSWVKSIKVAPHRISYRVADISEFVQHPVKKANLKKAILEHVLPLKQQ